MSIDNILKKGHPQWKPCDSLLSFSFFFLFPTAFSAVFYSHRVYISLICLAFLPLVVMSWEAYSPFFLHNNLYKDFQWLRFYDDFRSILKKRYCWSLPYSFFMLFKNAFQIIYRKIEITINNVICIRLIRVKEGSANLW